VVAELGTVDPPEGIEVLDGEGRHLFPGFVDPHVHLRTPGREDEETIASGTAAGAAGGYCAILAMPNTEPVVDSAAVLGSLIETQVRAGLVTRMAVLYDLLTNGPIEVKTQSVLEVA
jgi:dihydroorotase-like cyclic amidohydrolase